MTTSMPATLLPAHLDARFSLIRDSKHVRTRPFILAVQPGLDHAALSTALSDANAFAGHSHNSLPRRFTYRDADHERQAMAKYAALTRAAEQIGAAGDRAFAGQPDFVHTWLTCVADCAASLLDIEDAVAAGDSAELLNLNDAPMGGALSELAACPNLRSLSVGGQGPELDGELGLDLTLFPKLRALEIADDDLRVLPNVQACSDLRYLGVSRNRLTHLRGVETLSQLLYLGVRGNPLADGELERIHQALPNCKIVA